MTSPAFYVLYTFMSAAPQSAEPTATPGPQNQADNRHGRLLGLVRKILDYGRDLVTSLKHQTPTPPSTPIARRFGTFNLALIIARITRGLCLAAGLEARLLRPHPARTAQRTTQDRATTPTNPRPARPPRPRPPTPSQSEDDAALLRALPTAEEIAARIRHRTTGAVIVEICRDLGIDATHALWPQIRDAIIAYDGSLARMLTIWMSRASALIATLSQDAPARQAWAGPLPASAAPS